MTLQLDVDVVWTIPMLMGWQIWLNVVGGEDDEDPTPHLEVTRCVWFVVTGVRSRGMWDHRQNRMKIRNVEKKRGGGAQMLHSKNIISCLHGYSYFCHACELVVEYILNGHLLHMAL